MQMIQCTNCGKLSGFKRALGFGTFFMVVLTLGLWLLAIPFYPMRCINCGLTRHSVVLYNFRVWYWSLNRKSRAFLVILPGLILLGIGIFNAIESDRQKPESISENISPFSNTSPTDISSRVASPSTPQAEPPSETVRINGSALLKEYEENEQASDARYKNAHIVLTGPLMQVFVPSTEESLRMAKRGYEADAVLMIDSPPVPPSDPGQALFTPGISAHSKNGSFFGFASYDESPLRTGDLVTVMCDGATNARVSELTGGPRSMFGDIAISLADCVLQVQ
jgi:hypothetical protein